MSGTIEISGLSKSYGKHPALDNISLSVAKGELFGLIGPDGAGKSSLYRILATLSRPDKGHASVCGLDTVSDYGRIRSKIGYMPERFSLYQDLTVSENLKFFASLFSVSVRDNYNLIAPVFGQLERFPNRKAITQLIKDGYGKGMLPTVIESLRWMAMSMNAEGTISDYQAAGILNLQMLEEAVLKDCYGIDLSETI